ncbi:MAG: acyl-CoA dehydrogenase [Acidimicrobiia bacterium]
MPIGISDEHVELGNVAKRWCEQHCPPSVPRAILDADHETLPPFWPALSELGWTGLAIDEAFGGAGYTVNELAVVLEALGYVVAPGPFVPTVTAAALVQSCANNAAKAALLPGLAAGTTVATFAPLGAQLDGAVRDSELTVQGTLRAVPSAHLASVVLASVALDEGEVWVALTADDFTATELASVDRTRRVAEVVVNGANIPDDRVLTGLSTDVARRPILAIALAELVGVAQWAVDTAAEYAKVRVQFDRPIGQFQGVKHRCADMLVRTELARAAVWDAVASLDDPDVGASSLAISAAAALTLDAALQTTKECIQTLGGIGFTWEHDAHMYMKRAAAARQLIGTSDGFEVRSAQLTLAGARRALAVDLPAEAEQYRPEVRAFLDELKEQPRDQWNELIAAAGYVVPSWPKPYGREAGAVEQIVIEEEFKAARIRRVSLMVGAWALPTVIVFGTDAQKERWVVPSLRGQIMWCQLFSEPGSGSDLASLTTRAERVEGGFVLNGQKVWTSMAQMSQWGILLARTDPSKPKHDGISCFMLDMQSPGITIRPLRELTGESMFNEVFFDDVFIPDDCLVGDQNDGWRAARTTLANERVFMGGGASMGPGVESLLALVRDQGLEDDDLVLREVGHLVAESHALAVLGTRMTLRAVTGADPSGAEASVRKLLGVLHDQQVQETGLSLFGIEGAVSDGVAQPWVHGFLWNQNLTIAGGTSQIQRNVIAERLLGLPRDP